MSLATLDQELAAELAAIAADCGCELAHAEFDRGTLRVILDRPESADDPEGSVTIADCQAVSKQISSLLDIRDFGKDRYLLEVGSPGLDRQLYGPKDYTRFCGKQVRVTFFYDESRKKRTVVGRLEDFSADGEGVVTVVTSSREEKLEIPLPDIKVARLEIEL